MFSKILPIFDNSTSFTRELFSSILVIKFMMVNRTNMTRKMSTAVESFWTVRTTNLLRATSNIAFIATTYFLQEELVLLFFKLKWTNKSFINFFEVLHCTSVLLPGLGWYGVSVWNSCSRAVTVQKLGIILQELLKLFSYILTSNNVTLGNKNIWLTWS